MHTRRTGEIPITNIYIFFQPQNWFSITSSFRSPPYLGFQRERSQRLSYRSSKHRHLTKTKNQIPIPIPDPLGRFLINSEVRDNYRCASTSAISNCCINRHHFSCQLSLTKETLGGFVYNLRHFTRTHQQQLH